MSPTMQPDSIFAHPALAGTTLMVRHGDVLAAYAINLRGLRPAPMPDWDPGELAWRGGFSR